MSDFPSSGGAGVLPGAVITSTGPETIVGDALTIDGGLIAGVGAWPAANRALYFPFAVEAWATIRQIGWENGTTVAGNVDVGLYELDGTRVVASGSLAQSGVSAAQFADITDTLLVPGRHYFMAMSSDSATATFIRTTSLAALTLQACGIQQQASAFPLPATATFANPASAYLPIITLATQATA